jgi:hypothetical protein
MDFVKFSAPAHPALNALAQQINDEAVIGKVPPCALAAIVMRESGGQNIFQRGMPKGPGCGVGLTQITAGVDWTNPDDPRFQGYRLLDPQQNLYVAAAFFLAPAINQCLVLREQKAAVMAQFSDEILYFAFAAYNAGFGAVSSAINNGSDPDARTTSTYAAGTLAFYHDFLQSSHAGDAQPVGAASP